MKGASVLVKIETEGKDILDFFVDPKDILTVTTETSPDGSFEKTFTTKYGAKLIRTHHDDAADYWVIDDLRSKLTCAVEY